LIVGRSFVDMNKYVSLAEQNGMGDSLVDLSIEINVVELVKDNADG